MLLWKRAKLGQERIGKGDLIRVGSEWRGGRGVMKEDWFHLEIEETDEGMRISCHNEEKVSVPKLALFLTPSHHYRVLDKPAHKGIYQPPFH